MEAILQRAFADAASALDEFRTDSHQQSVLNIAQSLASSLADGHKAIACGNGGSMADAMHFAEEWTGRFKADRPSFPVIAISDPTHLSCVANDYGYDQVFARYLLAVAHPGDLLFVLSTTGNSPNLVRAVEAGEEIGMVIIGILGRDGGTVLPHCDLALVAPGEDSARIQEIHMLALHAIIEAAESVLCA